MGYLNSDEKAKLERAEKLRASAEAGDENSMYMIALGQIDGIRGEASAQWAAYLLPKLQRDACERKEKAMLRLARLYLSGNVPGDIDEITSQALDLLHDCADMHNSFEAARTLCSTYSYGLRIDRRAVIPRSKQRGDYWYGRMYPSAKMSSAPQTDLSGAEDEENDRDDGGEWFGAGEEEEEEEEEEEGDED